MGEDVDNLLSPKNNKDKTLTETFDELFPYFLEMGMTYDLYWNDRVEIAKAYLKANQLKNKRINEEMWLQGIYVRHALLSTVGNMFVKNKSKMNEYPKEPLPITQSEFEKMKEKQEKEKFEAMKNKMIQASQKINKDKGGG